MRERIAKRSLVLLTVFTVGGLLLPVAHQFSHLRNASSQAAASRQAVPLPSAAPNGPADEAEDPYGRAEPPRTGVPHYASAGSHVGEHHLPFSDVDCELCARLALNIILVDESARVIGVSFDTAPLATGKLSDRAPESHPIRGPPLLA